jgi:predicted negative regulator of RcsB-dependent stress response
MWENIKRNWKTNLVALIAFVYTVPQAVICVQNWVNKQPCNWRSALLGLLLAAGAAVAKDSDNHSTVNEVDNATVQNEWKPFDKKEQK